jgi:hypothetical protein
LENAFLKQYEEFSASNNLSDFGLKKSLDHLDAVSQKFQIITDRFAGCQAPWLNVHVDFPVLQGIALPIINGPVRYPGIKIHEPGSFGCWTAAAISAAGPLSGCTRPFS